MGLHSYMDMPMMVIVLTALSADREKDKGWTRAGWRQNEGRTSTPVKKLKLKKRQKFAAASGAESSSSRLPSWLPLQPGSPSPSPVIIRIRVLCLLLSFVACNKC